MEPYQVTTILNNLSVLRE